MKYSLLLLFVAVLFASTDLTAQRYEWNGRPANETVREYVSGIIHKMDTDRDCSNYAYGKDRYQRVDIYSYSTDGVRIRVKFRFHWRIDWMIGGHSNYSFTVSASLSPNGCNTMITYEDETGGTDCECSIGRRYELGCVYGS